MNQQDWKLIKQIKELVQNLPPLSIPPKNCAMVLEADGCMEGWGGVIKWKPKIKDPRSMEKPCAYARMEKRPRTDDAVEAGSAANNLLPSHELCMQYSRLAKRRHPVHRITHEAPETSRPMSEEEHSTIGVQMRAIEAELSNRLETALANLQFLLEIKELACQSSSTNDNAWGDKLPAVKEDRQHLQWISQASAHLASQIRKNHI
ncbi:hypothetical protein EJ110_NYTH57881 [Nymphaea thermarum]|nr:hypothetical protein EJ110_NYTH57881 [Nymphaea thermarum]